MAPDAAKPKATGPLVASVVVGLTLGGLTVVGIYHLFPGTWAGWLLSPSKIDAWKAPTLLVGSGLAIVAAYVLAASLGATRVADALVIGYVMALVLAAGLAISKEVVLMLELRVPGNLGLKTVAATPDEPHRLHGVV